MSTSEMGGLLVWDSKPSADRFTGLGLKTGRGGRFADLGFKIGGAFGAAGWRSWRKCGIIVKLFVF